MLGYKSRGDGDRAGFRASAKPIASEPPIAGAPTIAPSGASGQAAGGLMGPAGVKACGKARTPWEGCVASLPSPSSEVRGACRAIRSASFDSPPLGQCAAPLRSPLAAPRVSREPVGKLSALAGVKACGEAATAVGGQGRNGGGVL